MTKDIKSNVPILPANPKKTRRENTPPGNIPVKK